MSMGYSDYREALAILEKYDDGNRGWVLEAEHDVLYSHVGMDVEMDAKDSARLKELGWHKDRESNTWACFT